MKKQFALRLSFWAKSHRPAAIALIVVSKIAIGAIGFVFGLSTALEGAVLPVEFKWLLAAVAAASIFAYPAKRLKKSLGRAVFYRRQKIMDGVLVALGFAILFFVGNLAPTWVAQPGVVAATSAKMSVAMSVVEKSVEENQKELVQKPVEKNKKETLRGGKIKRWIASKVKAMAERAIAKFARANEDGGIAGKLFLSLLLIVAATFLLALVASLSCNLSCSGQEGLAILVGVLGVTGIIIGSVLGFSAIWQKKESKDLDRRHQKPREPTKVIE